MHRCRKQFHFGAGGGGGGGQILSCKGRTLQTLYEPLMPDVVVPKAQQNNHSYVSSADLPSDSLCKNFVWWVVTRRTLKNYKTVKIGGWVLAWVWALARDNTVVTVWCFVLCKSYFYLSNSALVECQVLG